MLGDFIQLRTFAGNGDGVAAKIQTGFVIRRLRFEHAVARLFGAARLGNDNGQRVLQTVADLGERALHAVGIGIVEEERIHFIFTGPRQRIGNELRPQRRAADADNQKMLELPALLRHHFAAVNLRGERFDALQNLRDLRAQIVGRQIGVAQPIMADHALFVGVGDGAALQFVHLRVGGLQFRLEVGKELVVKRHPRDVERETQVGVGEVKALKAVPELKGIHNCFS